MSEALGVLETLGLTPSMVALDAIEKAARVQVIQSELNDLYGVLHQDPWLRRRREDRDRGRPARGGVDGRHGRPVT